MRLVMALLAVSLLAGCLDSWGNNDACEPRTHVYYFTAEHQLTSSMPMAGEVTVGGFDRTFVRAAADPFLSAPHEKSLLLEGNVVLQLWWSVEGVAPVADGSGSGYHWYTQFGNQLSYMPEGAVEYRDMVERGMVKMSEHTMATPEGGFRIEAGDSVRALLTTLVVDRNNTGPKLHVGPETPSQIMFTARCIPTSDYMPVMQEQQNVTLAGNHGLLTGALPTIEGVNRHVFAFELQEETDRLTILLNATEAREPKSDIDLFLVDTSTEPTREVWVGGSPATDEGIRMWRTNLDALMPPGTYEVWVDAYSGAAYEGTLTVLQEAAV